MALLHHALDVVSEFLHHHLIIALGGLALLAVVVLIIFVLARKPGECTSIEAPHIGHISTCSEQPRSREEPVPENGLHGDVYTDRQAGYALTLPNPDRWSIIPATDLPDPQTGQTAKGFAIPAGVLADMPLGFLTNDAITAFITRPKSNEGAVTVWVYRIPTLGRTAEEFVRDETGPDIKMRRTGAVVAAYAASRKLTPRPPTPSGTGGGIVKISTEKIPPDHKSALLLWVTPYLGLDADIVGRFVVGEPYTYYIVALRPKTSDRSDEQLNFDVRTMIETLHPIPPK